MSGGIEVSQDSFFELLGLYFGEKCEIRTFVRIYQSLFIVLLNVVLSKFVLLHLPVINVVTMEYCITSVLFFSVTSVGICMAIFSYNRNFFSSVI